MTWIKTSPPSEVEDVRCAVGASQLTRDATRISAQVHDRLRATGFDDKAILRITLIAAWFNYINRVADALGVGRD